MISNKEEAILKSIKEKAILKQQVFLNTYNTFKELKGLLSEIEVDYNKKLDGSIPEKAFVYKDLSEFQCELKITGDLLIFQMHSDVFEFDREHGVWKVSYVQKNDKVTYSGIINIYNFLSASFKNNRNNDLGYLIGRIFINKDLHYFVEGKRQMGYLYNNFGSKKIDKNGLKQIVDTAIAYAIDFDLLVPPYDNMKIITVEQIQQKRNRTPLQTGKRLGFAFRSDDIHGEEPIYSGG